MHDNYHSVAGGPQLAAGGLDYDAVTQNIRSTRVARRRCRLSPAYDCCHDKQLRRVPVPVRSADSDSELGQVEVFPARRRGTTWKLEGLGQRQMSRPGGVKGELT